MPTEPNSRGVNNMNHNDILREIVLRSQGDACRRAALELSKTKHSDTVLWRIYRAAQAEGVAYSDAVVAAMQDHEKRMTADSSTRKTRVLQIRLTENELSLLHLLASKKNQTVSDYIRSKCLSEEVTDHG